MDHISQRQELEALNQLNSKATLSKQLKRRTAVLGLQPLKSHVSFTVILSNQQREKCRCFQWILCVFSGKRQYSCYPMPISLDYRVVINNCIYFEGRCPAVGENKNVYQSRFDSLPLVAFSVRESDISIFISEHFQLVHSEALPYRHSGKPLCNLGTRKFNYMASFLNAV